MKISKKDALSWFEFFSELPEDEEISPRQMEIALSVFCQIEKAVSARHAELMRQIPHLKTLQDRTALPRASGSYSAACSDEMNWNRPKKLAAALYASPF